MSCWEKGTDNVFPETLKTPENDLITFIFINWRIIIHFTTNWSLGAPVHRVLMLLKGHCHELCMLEFVCSGAHGD